MVLYISLSVAEWNDVKQYITDRKGRDALALYLYKRSLSLSRSSQDPINQRIVVRVCHTTTSKERCSIYKLNTKNMFKCARMNYDCEEDATYATYIAIELSKQYVSELSATYALATMNTQPVPLPLPIPMVTTRSMSRSRTI